jgi:TolA-binding protein
LDVKVSQAFGDLLKAIRSIHMTLMTELQKAVITGGEEILSLKAELSSSNGKVAKLSNEVQALNKKCETLRKVSCVATAILSSI